MADCVRRDPVTETLWPDFNRAPAAGGIRRIQRANGAYGAIAKGIRISEVPARVPGSRSRLK